MVKSVIHSVILTTEKAKEMILASDGRIFAVRFVKRSNGEIRKMICRMGVSKDVKGTGKKVVQGENGLLNVFSIQDDGYRSIPLEGLFELKIGGVTYQINERLVLELNQKHVIQDGRT